jgi:P27 family predicted phage terminase small subunit
LGARGRAPRSAEEQLALGDPRKRGKKALERQAEHEAEGAVVEVAPELMRPVKPTWLSKNAAKVWDREVPKMIAINAVRSLDSYVIADYCQMVAEAERCQRVIATKGYFKTNANRTKSKREEVSLLKELRAGILKLSDQLGMTPKARKAMNITVKAPEPKNDSATRANVINTRRTASQVVVAMVPARPGS